MTERKDSKNVHILYLVVTLVFLGEVVLTFNGYSYFRYYSDKVINWIWLGMTIFMIVRFWKKTDYPSLLDDALQDTSKSSDEYPPIQAARLVNINKTAIGIEYHIMDKKRIYYHK